MMRHVDTLILSLSVAFVWDMICLELQDLKFEAQVSSNFFLEYQKRPSLSVRCGCLYGVGQAICYLHTKEGIEEGFIASK